MPFNITAGLVGQGLSSLAGIVSGIGQLRQAKKIKPEEYQFNDPRLNNMASPYAQQMLGRAQMQVNARIPGAAARERQIQAGTAGTQAAIRRGAVDSSMAMQGILAAQAQGNQQVDNQTMMEAQMQQQREANLMNAQGTMISERDKAFGAMQDKYRYDMDRKMALQNAGMGGISGGLGGLSSGFFGAERLRQLGGFGNNNKKTTP